MDSLGQRNTENESKNLRELGGGKGRGRGREIGGGGEEEKEEKKREGRRREGRGQREGETALRSTAEFWVTIAFTFFG